MKMTDQSTGDTAMHTVEIIENEMIVMDEDGQVGDVVSLTSYRSAKRAINTWAWTYTIEVAAAYRLLEAYFDRRIRC